MFDSIIGTQITVTSFLICTAVSLILGLGAALLARFRNRTSRSFSLCLAMMPVVVELVIMLVNGNIGAGLGVAGAFSLVRFRSAQGTARDIALLFFAVALGLATGMGYVVMAAIFFLIVAAFLLVLTLAGFSAAGDTDRLLRVQIPESMDYDGLLDDLLAAHTRRAELISVKSTNLGTIYELQYEIRLKTPSVPKELLDGIRCRNGNLNVTCGRIPEEKIL